MLISTCFSVVLNSSSTSFSQDALSSWLTSSDQIYSGRRLLLQGLVTLFLLVSFHLVFRKRASDWLETDGSAWTDGISHHIFLSSFHLPWSSVSACLKDTKYLFPQDDIFCLTYPSLFCQFHVSSPDVLDLTQVFSPAVDIPLNPSLLESVFSSSLLTFPFFL